MDDETAIGSGEDKAKRARKRSRYLTDDYETPTILHALHGAADRDHHHHCILTPPPPPRNGVVNEGAAPDLLAALHRSAACPYHHPPEAALLAFFALHRDSASMATTHRAKDTTTCISSSSSSKDGAASAAARLNPCRAMAVLHGSAANAKEQGSNMRVGVEAAPSKRRRNKKPTANTSPKQGQHSGKPVALILQFAAQGDHPPPSKEQLHATFRGFGPLIEPSTHITKKQARVVFRSSAAAEAAYGCVHTLGAFAAARLQYLRPPPPPAPKIPLTDVRKNLEKMIASLTGPSLLGKDSAWSLAGEMQHLLFKVDRAWVPPGQGLPPRLLLLTIDLSSDQLCSALHLHKMDGDKLLLPP